MTAGVDIYRYQTVTDWRAFATFAKFAWVKLTDGNGRAQVAGDKQVNGCKSVGVPVGGYHYAQPGDPTRQARVFLDEVRRLGADDIAPALDLEAPFTPDANARSFALSFLREVVRQGYRPAVYMSASWAGALRPDRWDIPGLVIWVAAYGSNNGRRDPASVAAHYPGRVDVHQYTSIGRVPGVRGNTDLNWALTGVPANRKDDDMPTLREMLDEKLGKDGNTAFDDWKGKPGTLGHWFMGQRQYVAGTRQLVAAQGATIDKLADLLAAGRHDLTADEVKAAVRDAIKDAVVKVDVTVTDDTEDDDAGTAP